MNATALLNSIDIPTRGLYIGRGIERARRFENSGGIGGPQVLFVQALWRYDLDQCDDHCELDRFINRYCPGVDREDTATLDEVFHQRTACEYCTFYGI